MRVQGGTNLCKRWYVTFDGEECKAPVQLDAVILLELDDNLHRPGTIDGHCLINKKGLINVEYRIGNCPGYGNSDGATGWNSSSRVYIEEVFPSQ